MKRLLVLLTAAALVLLPAAAATAKRGGGEHGNRGGNGQHNGWDKQGSSGGSTDGQQAPGARDRSIESGGSYPQGHSTSDPDGMSNGGADKPGGSGGIDQTDQDGNNGCGNDADFEDDNNGNCGGGHKKPKEEVVVDAAVAQPVGTVSFTSPVTSFGLVEALPRASVDAAVLRIIPPAPVETAAVEAPAPNALENAVAAAAHFTSDVAGGAGSSLRGILPLTGMEIAMIALMGLVLIAGGAVLRRIHRHAMA